MNTVVAVFEDLAHVDCAVRALQSAHVSSDRICVVSSRRSVVGEAAAVRAEGADDLLIGFATMAIPPFGPLFATGGFRAALVGPHVHSEHVLDDLIAAGVPPVEAEDYAAAVRAGASAVLVAATPDDLERVAQTLAGCQPIEIDHPRPHAGDPDPE
jgi:hypothetical protein